MSQQQTAFPYNRPSLSASGKWETIAEPGMYLRDWFAGQALAGFTSGTFWGDNDDNVCAEACYKIADAMMKERVKK